MNTPDQPHSSLRQRMRDSQARLADWPVPDAEAVAHSEKLIASLRQQITQHNGLSFHDYMQQVLYAPGLGYYSAGASKFGAGGDFVTAPEISPLFARCIGHALLPVLQQQPDYQVLEVGAGTGQLAAGLLDYWAQQGLQPRYAILELSADLKARQQHTLAQQVPASLPQVEWLSRWPTQFNGIMLANELLDAMPVHLLHKHNGSWYERYVINDQDRFAWQDRPVSEPQLIQRVRSLDAEQTLPDDYLTEVNLAAEHWLATLAAHLEAGLALILDYGFARHEYYHPQRQRGTLMCHYRHRAHDDPFVYPGLQDITAHIDFTAMADAAVAAGLSLQGYTTQAHFLLENNLTGFLEASAQDERAYVQRVNEVRRLTLPQEMGEIFKVMCLGRHNAMPVSGFSLRDLRHQL